MTSEQSTLHPIESNLKLPYTKQKSTYKKACITTTKIVQINVFDYLDKFSSHPPKQSLTDINKILGPVLSDIYENNHHYSLNIRRHLHKCVGQWLNGYLVILHKYIYSYHVRLYKYPGMVQNHSAKDTRLCLEIYDFIRLLLHEYFAY